MTAAMTADYWGETNNAINYGSIYIWKALGGSFAGGLAALVMTGTLYGSEHFNWTPGFLFGATLGLLAAIVVFFKCRPPTVEQMRAAVEKAATQPQPVVAPSS
jgi:predicted lipid-binding transport protein (Tim44 family)